MGTSTIPVDVENPGQVFACLGFVESLEALELGPCTAGFAWDDVTEFHLSTPGAEKPVAAVLDFLARADIESISPQGSEHRTEKWKVRTRAGDDDMFPFAEPDSPATLPAVLRAGDGRSVTIDHWGDITRDNVKFWAGAGGYPGCALARDALDLVRSRLANADADPFSLSTAQSSSFRFDWRRDYIPMDVGFSPNAHADMTMVGFPVVEILAAIGLTHARPKRIEKLRYQYGIAGGGSSGALLHPIFLRAALGAARLPFPQRTFEMRLDWPGQENQARSIVDIREVPHYG